jgi:hypothetical protein
MKNIIISLMAGYIISGFGIWQYQNDLQKAVVALGMALIIAIVLMGIDDRYADYKRKKRACDRLKKQVEELTNKKAN